MRTHIFHLQTLTPIHTGDYTGKTSYLRATSLLGGLRFWTEAFFRSFGYRVCDITGKETQRCHLDENPDQLCAVCRLFGCTGLSRQFSLRVLEAPEPTRVKQCQISPSQCQYEKDGRKRFPTWYLPKMALQGRFTLQFSPLRPDLQEARLQVPEEILAAFYLMVNFGSLGAKDQYGYGVVEMVDKSERQAYKDLTLRVIKRLSQSSPARTSHDTSDYANLKDFFFFKAVPNQKKAVGHKTPFLIRYKVRRFLKAKELRHYFCGHLKEKQATKFHLAWVKGRLYGWGWFPRKGRWQKDRDECLNVLQEGIKAHCQDLQWREFSSSRDTTGPCQDWTEFLQKMVGQKWRD